MSTYKDRIAAPQVKEKPQSNLRRLIAWLETQAADTEYAWYVPSACLMCRYFQAQGRPTPWADGGERFRSFFMDHGDPDGERYYQIGYSAPWTFGAALERARALVNAPSTKGE